MPILGVQTTSETFQMRYCMMFYLKEHQNYQDTVVSTPSKSKHKVAKISKFWGPERLSKYICHLSNIKAYFVVRN